MTSASIVTLSYPGTFQKLRGRPLLAHNSETISQNHIKFGVSRVNILDYSVINFQVNRTYPSRVIVVGSWVRFCVDSFFLVTLYYDTTYNMPKTFQNMVTVLGFGTGGSRLIQKHFDKVTGRLRDSVSYLRMSASGPFKQLGLPDGLYFIRPKHLQSKFESESIVYHGKVEERKHMHKWVLKNFHGLCGHR